MHANFLLAMNFLVQNNINKCSILFLPAVIWHLVPEYIRFPLQKEYQLSSTGLSDSS